MCSRKNATEIMNKKVLFIVLLLLIAMTAEAQRFTYTYNGVTVTYEVISIPKHEVKVKYVPKNVTAVTIPASVHFNGEAFRVIEIGDGSCMSGGGLFSDCNDYYSFNNCKLLKTVVLPNTIKIIGERAFEDCVWLRTINLPSGLKKIGCAAFRGCESLNLSSITLPSSLTSLGDYERWGFGTNGNIFKGCSGTLYIPATIDTIGYEALNGISFRLSKQIGVLLDDTIILSNGFLIANENETKYKNGKKIIDSEAFGYKYKVRSLNSFVGIIFNNPRRYLEKTKGTPLESTVKEILIKHGKYEEVLSYYPNDKEVKRLKTVADAKLIVAQGDSIRRKHQYVEAKSKYMEALRLLPGNQSIQQRITNIDAEIAEIERQREEAEAKTRREAEKKQVRLEVERLSIVADSQIKRGKLQEATITLQQAIDTAKAHDYDYRQLEFKNLIDSIRNVQSLIAESDRTYEYKTIAPKQYYNTEQKIASNLTEFMKEKGKKIKHNEITLTLHTDNNRDASFTIGESSRAIKGFCQEQLKTVHLLPVEIDNRQLSLSATFKYSFEYAQGLVKVKQDNNEPLVRAKYKMSPQLKYDMDQFISTKMRLLPSSCDGKYKFDVTSININEKMTHDIKVKSYRFKNGPQNAWRSVLVPGWGDKYVEDDGQFDWGKTIASYGLVSMGIYLINNTIKYTTTESGWVYDSVWVEVTDPFSIAHGDYSHWVETNPHYETKDIQREKKNKGLGIACTVIGATIWVGDIIHVWVKGSKNKKENMNAVWRLFVTYDSVHDTPILNYTLRF